MTREEKVNKLVSLKEEAEKYAQEFNEARFDDKPTDDIERHIGMAVEEYDKIVREMYYDDCIASGNTMLAAALQSDYISIAAKDKKITGTEVKRKEIEFVSKTVDLLKLQKYAGNIGANKNWFFTLQKLNYLMAVRVGKEIKAIKTTADMRKFSDSFAMNQIARDTDLGKTPDSNTGFLRLIQQCVDEMLGEGYKVTSHDAAWLQNGYTTLARQANTLKIPNHSRFVKIMLGVLRNAATGCGYQIEYQLAKNTAHFAAAEVKQKVAAAESRRRPPKAAKSGKSAKSEPVSEPAPAEVAA